MSAKRTPAKPTSRASADALRSVGSLAATAGFLGNLLWLFAIAAPLLALVAALAVYALDAPYADEWWEVPTVHKAFDHTLTFHDLWAPHNEHRIVLSRLVIIANAYLTHWDTRWEMALSVVLSLVIFLLLARLASLTARALGGSAPPWLLFFLSLLVFSLAQQENWFWGVQMVMFMCALASVGSLLLLNMPAFSWGRLAGAIALYLASLGTIAGGLIVFPAGCVGLLPWGRKDPRLWRWGLPVWAGVGMVTTWLYFRGFHQLQGNASPLTAFERPEQFLGFILAYLGAPLYFYYPRGAMLLGGLGVILTAAALVWLVRVRRVSWMLLLPYLLIILFVLGNAAITAVGRVSGGIVLALAPRYLAISLLFWTCTATLLALAVVRERKRPWDGRRLAVVGLVGLAFVGMVFFGAMNSLNGLPLAVRRYQELKVATQALRDGNEAGYGELFGGRLPWLMAERQFLADHHLSVFREGAPPGG
jgi:hypothetical protein